MEFKEFNGLLQKHLEEMCKNETHLFVIDVDKDVLWNLYLDSFPRGANEMFRKRREFDCSCCRHFIRSFGNVVAIKDNKVVTVWDFETTDSIYQPVVNALSSFVKSRAISDVLVTDQRVFGIEKTFESGLNADVKTWYHFHAVLPKNVTLYNNDLNETRGRLRDVRNVFERSLKELSIDAVDTVLDLCAQKSLYKGEEWEAVLGQFRSVLKEYGKLDPSLREVYCWKKSVEVGPVIGKIRNHSIGTLLINVSEGMDLDDAVKKYEAIVAPSNYKRPKAIFSKRMVEDAQKTIQGLGLESSLERRYANIGDITINNTLFVNRDVKKRVAGDVFASLVEDAKVAPKQFSKLEEVGIDTFINDVLPKASSVELFLENKHMGNMVSLIAPKNADSKTMFKWDNNFSWAYSGNITDSMRDRVVAAGGRVDGVFRFTHSWNELERNQSLMDLHVFFPANEQHKDGIHDLYGNDERVGWNRRKNAKTGGVQDVDYTAAAPVGYVPIENITFPDLKKMPEGKYVCKIHNWSFRVTGGRGKAEIECGGNLYQYEYPKTKNKEWVTVAEVILKDGKFEVIHKLPESNASRQVWGVKTNEFCPVSIAMYSPNYWDGQIGVGHRHYFFMLKGCKNEESPNGFFNEFLREEFMKHKRVFEALGSKMKVEDSDDQLSGVGFSATKHDSFVVKIEGSFKRMLKVNI